MSTTRTATAGKMKARSPQSTKLWTFRCEFKNGFKLQIQTKLRTVTRSIRGTEQSAIAMPLIRQVQLLGPDGKEIELVP